MDAPPKETVSFVSCDGQTQISGTVWLPQGSPRAVVQLVHGMAEHIERYDDFACRLTQAGYIVCGHDHAGHGRSAGSPEQLGRLDARGGKATLTGDVGLMRSLIRARVAPEVPHILFGHSMGSFVVRSYIASLGVGLAGAIICGTGQMAPAVARAGNLLARLVCRTRGEDRVSGLLQELTVGPYARAVKDAQTPVDWLSFDRENVEAYLADGLCGFPFTAGANAALTELLAEVTTKACAERVDPRLPLLFIAGAEDPVGDMGKGVRAAAKMAQRAGSLDVTCRIYPTMRHEILNERGRDQVIDDMLQWIEERI